MVLPKLTERPALARAMAAFELFEQRLVALHVPEFTNLDITMAQAKLLYVLMAAGELSMSETAHRLGVTISTASGAVEHLVALGLLARSDDPNNRRQVRVSLTETGAQTLEQMRELSMRHLLALCSLVGDEDLAVVEHATQILADAALVAAQQPLPATASTATPNAETTE
jgi:DNA-binding MarR family transcriptional regulator